MDADTTVNVGNFCEQTLTDPTFQFISAYFEQAAVAEFLSTQPQELKRRESIYARVTAHREFLSMMKEFIDLKNKITEPQPDHQDEDDPAVHNIYRD